MAGDHVIIQCWRVEDDDSIARYVEGKGIVAGSDIGISFNPRRGYQRARLLEWVLLHLDWRNRKLTPFISGYGNHYRALVEAQRRVDAGNTNVVIHEILITKEDADRYGPIHFRKVRKLVEGELGSEIPDYADHNAEHEFLFLHRIPEEVIVESLELVG